ncbi:hypothetical protein BDR22DRAFT_888186 [Usnea florida]
MKASARGLQTSKAFQHSNCPSGRPRRLTSRCLGRDLTSQSGPTKASETLETVQARYTTDLTEKAIKRKHGDNIDQELFLDVLGSTATKRDAKAYLSRFGPTKPAVPNRLQSPSRKKDVGVNLGNLFVQIRAVDEKPVFSQKSSQPPFGSQAFESLHVALLKIRAPQSVDDVTLQGIGRTLSQISRLGMSPVVVVDIEDGQTRKPLDAAKIAIDEADRIAKAIDGHGGHGARRLDSVIGISSVDGHSVAISGPVRVEHRDLLMVPLRRGMIPVIASIAFNSETQKLEFVAADELVLALARDLAGIQTRPLAEDNAEEVAEEISTLQRQISLDRIIVLDPLGGIPATDRSLGSHVFINLEQEFGAIRKDLLVSGRNQLQDPSSGERLGARSRLCTLSNSIFKPADEAINAKSESQEQVKPLERDLSRFSMQMHVRNLDLLKDSLAILPPSSSAFLTTPYAVANSESRPPLASQGPRVRTRRQRNPLIHNLLTDKPVYSSSLPLDRSPNPSSQALYPAITPHRTTFLKRGMPIEIVPDPLTQPWAPPSISNTCIDLSDPRIDLSRLIYLIEDSFNRKLDVTHYLSRIKGRIAGIIIAGEYEGGAILTWETPPGFPADDPNHVVPYLDKFAVLRRSQGAGGVADVVFKAMVRDCFPRGVCWRSRIDNPVNKWYFERAKGTWKMPGTNWTMFWTTEGVERGDEVFLDYEGVCKTVMPSWADNQAIVD